MPTLSSLKVRRAIPRNIEIRPTPAKDMVMTEMIKESSAKILPIMD